MKKKLMFAIPAVMGAVTALAPTMAYAAETDASTAVTGAVGLVTGITSLFAVYPMNIFLGVGLASAGLALFARAKHTSGGNK